MSTLKRTPLFEVYERYGAKLVDFGGWELPVQFAGIIEEHHAVRSRAGLFDVSHMGEVFVQGPDAETYLQKMVTNDVSRLQIGQILYTPMCYPDGGTIDDLLIYKKDEQEYMVVVNAANIAKDVEWMQKHVDEFVEIKDASEQIALLALQGPRAEEILQKLTKEDLSEIKPFCFQDQVDIGGRQVLISRTGYTGEDGFELYIAPEDGVPLWDLILQTGEVEGVVPCGLGARDTLRFEAKLPLYGQELSPEITPLEAGLGFAVKLQKEVDFIGKEVLQNQKQQGLTRQLVGIEMMERGIPRHGYEVFDEDKRIGVITTGTQSPTLQKSIGLVLIDRDYAELETEVQVQIRKKKVAARVIKTPFYKRSK